MIEVVGFASLNSIIGFSGHLTVCTEGRDGIMGLLTRKTDDFAKLDGDVR